MQNIMNWLLIAGVCGAMLFIFVVNPAWLAVKHRRDPSTLLMIYCFAMGFATSILSSEYTNDLFSIIILIAVGVAPGLYFAHKLKPR